ncbi:MAG: alkaline phosphatase [Rhodospirillaceae bacterium]|nr:alkaline phosphatase [Rhodospirillaceae bacterium]OUT80235.1 MAG: alkaline phosphatase [Rhodospirillaceae bacterium TMED23]|tara:strand:- start:1127 stop:1444 length:318 start_codon:yes stop_codon:yes gene_type:complete
MDRITKLELEAAAFRGLVNHLQKRTDVQNIDIMNLAGFCRNCLSKWYLAAAKDRDIDLDFDAAREIIYGMPYSEWKDNHQNEASPSQQELYKKTQSLHAKIIGYE